jgi:hypothetical protein
VDLEQAGYAGAPIMVRSFLSLAVVSSKKLRKVFDLIWEIYYISKTTSIHIFLNLSGFC